MARGWLNSAFLPSTFWFYDIKCAMEISDFLPLKSCDSITTPFEFVHHVKPDICTLITLFFIAYIDKPMENSSTSQSFYSQSLRVIVIVRNNTSNCVDFYHHPSLARSFRARTTDLIPLLLLALSSISIITAVYSSTRTIMRQTVIS